MPALIDTNVIIDVITDDPQWAGWADEAIHRLRPGGAHINPVVYAELSAGTDSLDEVENIITRLELSYLEFPKSALFHAGQAFRAYRSKGGTKSSPLADFFIGGHAQASGLPIITRDVKRYQTYFPQVRLITP